MAVLLAQAMVVLLAQAILASPFEADPLVQTSPAANAEVVSGTSVTIRWRTPSALAPRERIKVYLTSAIAVVSPPPPRRGLPRIPHPPARPPTRPSIILVLSARCHLTACPAIPRRMGGSWDLSRK